MISIILFGVSYAFIYLGFRGESYEKKDMLDQSFLFLRWKEERAERTYFAEVGPIAVFWIFAACFLLMALTIGSNA